MFFVLKPSLSIDMNFYHDNDQTKPVREGFKTKIKNFHGIFKGRGGRQKKFTTKNSEEKRPLNSSKWSET